MTRVLFYPAISLDGFIARSDGDSSWVTQQDELMFEQEVQRAGCVIVGRTTFEQYRGTLYPLAGATTFVCTSQPDAVKQPTETGVVYVGGTVDAVLQEIQAAGFTSALLSGGGETNGRFAEAGAIDEMLVSVYPCVIGAGVRLFGQRNVQLNLSLLSTRQLSAGVVHNRYEVCDS